MTNDLEKVKPDYKPTLEQLQEDKIVFDAGGKLMYWLLKVANIAHNDERYLIVNKNEVDGYYEIVLNYDQLAEHSYVTIRRPTMSSDATFRPYEIIKAATNIRFDLDDTLCIGIPLVDAFLKADKRGKKFGKSLTSYANQAAGLILDKEGAWNCRELDRDLKELKLKLVFSECFESYYHNNKQLLNGELVGSVRIRVYYPIGKKENGALIYSDAIPEKFASICINGEMISITE